MTDINAIKPQETEPVDPLRRFLYLLNSSHAISVDDFEPTTRTSLAEFPGDPEDEFLLVEWEHESIGYHIKLTLDGISKGNIDNGAFVCEDHEGDVVRIKFFALTQRCIS